MKNEGAEVAGVSLTHPDKILYPKLTAIAQMVYQAGFNAANSDRTLTRDNKGPRAGRGFSGRIDK